MVINLKLHSLEEKLKENLQGWDKEINEGFKLEHNINDFLEIIQKNGADEIMSKLFQDKEVQNFLMERMKSLNISNFSF